MSEQTRDERPLNLEEQSLDELQRVPDCGNHAPTASEPLPETEAPHACPRCDSAERELLRNPFPTE